MLATFFFKMFAAWISIWNTCMCFILKQPTNQPTKKKTQKFKENHQPTTTTNNMKKGVHIQVLKENLNNERK